MEMSDDYASYYNAPSRDTLKGDIRPVEMSWIATANRYGVLGKKAAATRDLLCDSSDWSDSQVEIHCAFIKQAAKNKTAKAQTAKRNKFKGSSNTQCVGG